MDRNHMLAPASHRRTLSGQAPPASSSLALGPPPPLPLPRPLPLSLSPHHHHHPHHPHHHQQPLSVSLPPPTYSQVAPSSPMHHHQLSNSPPPPPPPPLPPSSSSVTARLPPLTRHDSDDKMLPSLSSIAGDFARRGDVALPPAPAPAPWPPTAYRQPPSPPALMDLDGAASVASAPSPSPERLYDGAGTGTPTPTSLTLDDPDVRLAAEALGDLRADFVSSPPDSTSISPMSPPAPPFQQLQARSARSKSPNPEPLLSLLTTAHPFVASTIGGASSAYGGAKNFSPRFKSGAEYVEGYLTPIANTVNSVGRVTGVEGGVRWFLGGRRRHLAPTSDPDSSAGSAKKRRKMRGGTDAKDSPELGAFDDSASVMSSKTPRRLSSASTVDTLPAYDDQRSPAYTETATNDNTPAQKPPNSAPWQARLIMSTSGLSIAMSAESLRSLKYCLRWLRWANDHMNRVIVSLKHALEEYERAEKSEAALPEHGAENMDVDGEQNRADTPKQSRTEIAARINTLKGDVLKTLQDVINNVSKYAGGALPENARVLVRRHLTSLPQRFRVATMSERSADSQDNDSDSALREGAQKVLVLAKEGLDMVTQVTGVLDGTIVSAEQWCERMGKRRRGDKEDEDEEPTTQPPIESNGDVKMG